jgi:hypothetical protein
MGASMGEGGLYSGRVRVRRHHGDNGIARDHGTRYAQNMRMG